MYNPKDLLTIQKLVYLLDDFHYNQFSSYLHSIHAVLPLKLTETIRKRLPEFDNHTELCKKIYRHAGKAEKQNFNQLSSYTFKLTSNLATNYPGYLQTNIERIQLLAAAAKAEEANFAVDVLLETAARINDFTSEIFALKFLSQLAFTGKEMKLVHEYDHQIRQASNNQQLLFELLHACRQALDGEETPKSEPEVKKLLAYFDAFKSHAAPAIRILSQYCALNIIFDLTPQKFTESDQKRVTSLRKEIRSYPYIVFPFMCDVAGNFEQLVLNSAFTNVFSKETDKAYQQLSAHYDSIKFWKNYFNAGELQMITVQATKLLSKYHYLAHLSNYQQIVEPADAELLASLKQKCRRIIDLLAKTDEGANEEVGVRMLYGAVLILSGGAGIKEGTRELETLLTRYQQVSFKRSTSSIFLCLMVGYFSAKDYKNCSRSYKRYLKSIKGKLTFESNHVKIQSYYYISQWLATRSRQYYTKLRILLEKAGNDGSQRTIWQLIRHFDLPIEVPNGMVIDLI